MLQGDEETIKKLLCFLRKTFPRLNFESKKSLKELFPEPKSTYLKLFWKLAHGDVVVYRHEKLVCVLEIGGRAHFSDKTQRLRDSKKDKICRINNVNCLRVSNSFLTDMVKPIGKKLLRKAFYG